MGKGKIGFSERKYKDRKKHSAKIVAGNGETLIITPPKQAYFNKPELIEALRNSKDILIEFFEKYDKN